VYAGGAFTKVGGATRYRVAALDPSSGAALGWAPYVNDDVKAVTTSNSGAHVYLGGDFTSVEGVGRRHLADIGASSGALSKSFKPHVGGGSFPAVLALDVSADGDTLYVGGFFGSIKASRGATRARSPPWSPPCARGGRPAPPPPSRR
jgi:hypothetical protein